jgi:ParB-like chromosome segregation protein Spo0J
MSVRVPTEGGAHEGVAEEPDRPVTPENWQADETPIVLVPVSSLQESKSPRVSGEDPQHIRALAETENELPPIIVHRETMRVIDGMHRLRAAELRGLGEIEVRFFDGNESDAFILSVKTNIAHGLPLSLADRKAAAVRIIQANPHWSDRLIASKAGLAAKTVGSMRDQDSATDTRPESRVGQDGKVRPVSSTEGRQIAGELMTDNPHLSLRQVAKAAGISPETVRDVRGRLRRGEDPVLPRQQGWRSAGDNGQGPARHPPTQRHDGVPPAEPVVVPMPIPDLPEVILQLRSDPALRFNEAGRALLKILDANTVINNRFDSIVDNVPEHCKGTLATAARECAQVWRSFATYVERGTDSTL